ncbi:MAG: hypothetical protein Q7S00_06900, partial [bacterium]|nr:hypothetical protein [bacterium]
SLFSGGKYPATLIGTETGMFAPLSSTTEYNGNFLNIFGTWRRLEFVPQEGGSNIYRTYQDSEFTGLKIASKSFLEKMGETIPMIHMDPGELASFVGAAYLTGH